MAAGVMDVVICELSSRLLDTEVIKLEIVISPCDYIEKSTDSWTHSSNI